MNKLKSAMVRLALGVSAFMIFGGPESVSNENFVGGPPRIVKVKCVLSEVAVLKKMVQLKCSSASYPDGRKAWVMTAITPFYYFAAPTTQHSGELKSFITLARQAIDRPKKVVYVETDLNDGSGELFGCETKNCRKILSLSIQ